MACYYGSRGSAITCLSAAVVFLLVLVGFARAQGPRGEVLSLPRPSNPPVHRSLTPPSEREPRRLSVSTQVEDAIDKGNKARDKANKAFSDEQRKQYRAEAERQYQRVLRLNLNDPRAYYGLGNVLADEDRYHDAIAAYQKAVQLKPHWAEAHLGLCDAYPPSPKAIEECKAAILLRPDWGRAHLSLGYVYSRLGRYTDAIEEYKLATSEGRPAVRSLAYAYKNAGRNSEEIEEWKALIRLNPSDREAHVLLGDAYAQAGRHTEAAGEYKIMARLEGDPSSSHEYLGIAEYLTGRYSEAIDELKTAIRLGADPPQAHYTLGVVYVTAGRYADAIGEFRTAINSRRGEEKFLPEIIPRADEIIPEARYALGLTYLKVNDKSAAMEQYEALKNLKSEYADKLLREINSR